MKCKECGTRYKKTQTCCSGKAHGKARIVSNGGIVFRPHTLGTMVWAWIEETSDENPMRLTEDALVWRLFLPNDDYNFQGSLMECLEAADGELSHEM